MMEDGKVKIITEKAQENIGRVSSLEKSKSIILHVKMFIGLLINSADRVILNSGTSSKILEFHFS